MIQFRSRRTVVRSLMGALLVFGLLALAGCPLPFEFAPSNQIGGTSGSLDPSNPTVTGPPEVMIIGIDSSAEISDRTPPANVSVSLETATRGAVIYYTVSPDAASEPADPYPGDQNTFVFDPASRFGLTAHGETVRLKAIAIGQNMYPSLTMHETVTVEYDPAATPQFSPAPGNFATDQSVTITTSTPGAAIYYTLMDGTGSAPVPSPGQAGTLLYAGPISVAGTSAAKSIAAIAVKDQMLNSPVAQGVFTIGYDGMSDPIITPNGGTFAADQSVSITVATTGATLWYTTDGTAPMVGGGGSTTSGTSPINLGLTQTTTLHVIASASERLDSNEVQATFEFVTGDPSFANASGTYTNIFSTTISSPSSGATIWYTTDGSTPQVGGGGSTQSALSPAALGVDTSMTVRAVAARTGWTNSAETSVTYTLRAAPPAFSVPSGTYPDIFDTVVTTGTAAATIWYTTDGSSPQVGGGPSTLSASSPLTVPVDSSMAIRAVASRTGFVDSTETGVLYALVTADPEFSTAPGSYSSGFDLMLTSATAGSVIHFTIDGSLPTGTSPVYSDPVRIIESQTVRAVAIKTGYPNSSVVSANYTLDSAYHTTNEAAISDLVPRMTSHPYPAPPGDYFPVGTTFIYQTSEGNFGKLTVKTVGFNFYYEYITYGASPTANHLNQVDSPGQGHDFDTDSRYGGSTAGTEYLWHWSAQTPAYMFVPDKGVFFRLAYEIDGIDRQEIENLSAGLSGAQIDNSDGVRIPLGAVIVYQTDEGRLGKLVVTDNNHTNFGLVFDYVTYAADGSVYASGYGSSVAGTWRFDFDVSDGVQGAAGDMQLVNNTGTSRHLAPLGTAAFWLTGMDETP
jgi:chitobiase/beta-hexosaminidase-like protein